MVWISRRVSQPSTNSSMPEEVRHEGDGGRRWEGGEWEEVDESVREPKSWETVGTVRG